MAQEVIIDVIQPLIIEVHTAEELLGLPNPKKGGKGDPGDKGDKGDTGPIGPKGDKGDTGDTGTALNNHIADIDNPHETKTTQLNDLESLVLIFENNLI